MATHLGFEAATTDGTFARSVTIADLVIAGWTGRNVDAMEAHIRELEELGVARPPRTPMFYRVGASLLTTDTAIDVAGTTSSGEVEAVVLSLDDGLWVTVGSDHTDRQAETVDVTLSKQACPKPVAPTLWRFADVADHWDALQLRSFVLRDGVRSDYQSGPVTTMRNPLELIALYREGDSPTLPAGTAMFGGTLPVIGTIGHGEGFELELEDPILGRTLRHRYTVRALPIAG